MGAGTSNSDLKNTYGQVSIQHRGQRVDTGMQFFGCVIGDYSKTAINTSIFTGKIVGVSSFLYGLCGHECAEASPTYARLFGQETECVLEAAVKCQGAHVHNGARSEQTSTCIKLMEDMYETDA